MLQYRLLRLPSKSQLFNASSLSHRCFIPFRWSKTSAKERSALMMKIADVVESRQDEFAEAESRDQGKPVWLAKTVDMNRVCLNFRFFASGILHVIDT